MAEPKILLDGVDDPQPERSAGTRWIPPLFLLVLVPVLVGIAVCSRQPPSLCSASDIILFILTALLCTLVAVSLTLAACSDWLQRTEHNSQTTATRMLAVQDTLTRLDEAVHRGHLEIMARLAQQEGQQHLVQEETARLTGGLQTALSHLAALREARQAQKQATDVAHAAWTEEQANLTAELHRLHAGFETLAETARQTGQAVTAATAGQTAFQEAIKHLADQVTGIGTAARGDALRVPEQAASAPVWALAAEQATSREAVGRAGGPAADATLTLTTRPERSAGVDLQLQTPAPATAGAARPDAAVPEPVQKPGNPLRLAAAQAVVHGAQMRYEVGPDRDNLGYWANPGDWAQWDLDVPRPGRFHLAAEIAALAPGRFQVLVGDEGLAGTAPATGDWGRFQKVELGAVDLATGKTRLAVRPIPEGWQPMNLKALALTPVA